MEKNDLNKENSILEGAISVKAALEAGSRDIYEIFADPDKDDKNIKYILTLARTKNIKITKSTKDILAEKTEGRTHGGIIASVGQRKFVKPEKLLAVEKPFIALLEGIEDPFNFGTALRSLYAAGATGLIIPARNWMSAAGTVARASAGASELIMTAATDDFDYVIKLAKEKAISLICAERKDAVSLYDVNLNIPLILAIGGEKRGLSKVITASADKLVYIPYGSNFRNSLSASAACSVVAFEIFRQRK
jgi:23S rRNA (guanosine2251-2'-O)-methyltransferase